MRGSDSVWSDRIVIIVAVATHYSRKQIDKAGKTVRRFVEAVDERTLAGIDLAAVDEAFEILEWWRSRHARPLTRVTANLRRWSRYEDTGTPRAREAGHASRACAPSATARRARRRRR